MLNTYYAATTIWVIFVAVIISIALVWLYRKGGASTEVQARVGLIFGIFIVFCHWVFGGKNIIPADISGLIFFAMIIAGALLVNSLFLITSWPVFRQLRQDHLQLVQGLRVFVGGGFLMEGVLGVIPAWFSIMDGFMHIASGFFALTAALLYAKKHVLKEKFLWLANIVGVTDILVIVTSICFLVWDDLGPFHNMHYIVFIGGPVLLWLHFVSITKLVDKPK